MYSNLASMVRDDASNMSKPANLLNLISSYKL